MKKAILLLLVLTIANVVVFVFRDYFQYYPYKSYQQLYKNCDSRCTKKWSGYTKIYTASERTAAKSLTDPIIGKRKNTLEKVQALSGHLYTLFGSRIGRPSTTLERQPALKKYRTLCSDKTQLLWCGTFSEMLALFCWSQNITCRNIEIIRPDDHHVMNECWIPELQQWVMTDAMFGMSSVKYNDSFVNVLQFAQAVQNHPGKLQYQYEGQSLPFNMLADKTAVQNFYLTTSDYYYYYVMNLEQVYNPWEKLKRYSLPVSWYEIFNNSPKSNIFFFIKVALLGLGVLALINCIYLYLKL